MINNTVRSKRFFSGIMSFLNRWPKVPLLPEGSRLRLLDALRIMAQKVGADALVDYGVFQIVSLEPYEGYWLDIGRPDDYMRAAEEFDQRKQQFLPPK